MLKLIFLLSIFYCHTSIAQGGFTQIIRFEIISTEVMVPLEGGTREWRSVGDMDSKMESKITLDFSKRKLFWDSKSRDGDKNSDGGIHVFSISSFKVDTTYLDFGFNTLRLNCTDDKNKIINYEIIEYQLQDCRELYLIVNEKDYKSRSKLKLIK